MKKWVSALAVLLIIPVLFTTSTCQASNEVKEACYLPQPYIDLAFQMQEEYGVSACLICSIIQHESSGYAFAQNGNCKGLMQVSDVNNPEGLDLFDEPVNVRLGTEILLRYIDKADGEIYLALGWYHGERHPSIDNPSMYVRSVMHTAYAIEKQFYEEGE